MPGKASTSGTNCVFFFYPSCSTGTFLCPVLIRAASFYRALKGSKHQIDLFYEVKTHPGKNPKLPSSSRNFASLHRDRGFSRNQRLGICGRMTSYFSDLQLAETGI